MLLLFVVYILPVSKNSSWGRHQLLTRRCLVWSASLQATTLLSRWSRRRLDLHAGVDESAKAQIRYQPYVQELIAGLRVFAAISPNIAISKWLDKALATRNCISLETQIGYLLLASHDSMLCRSYDQPVLPRMTGSFMITCRSRTVHFGSNHKSCEQG